MLEIGILISVVAVAFWMAFGKGVYKQQTKEMKVVLQDVKKTKKLRRSLRNKSIRSKLRNYFK